MGQRQRALGPPCEEKSRRLGALAHLRCHRQLQSHPGGESLALPETYTFITHFLSQKTFLHHQSSRTCLYRTQACFRRGTCLTPVLHFVKSPRHMFVHAPHEPGGQGQAVPRSSTCPTTSLRIFPAALCGGWKRVWGDHLGESNCWAALGCRCVPQGKVLFPERHTRTRHTSPVLSISTDPPSLLPPSRCREGDNPGCSAGVPVWPNLETRLLLCLFDQAFN